MAHTLISQESALGVGPLVGEAIQGVGQLRQLLAAHQRQNLIVLRTWVEAAVDMGEPLPSYNKRVSAVVAAIEAAALAAGLGVSGLGGLGIARTSAATGEGSSGVLEL